MQKRHSENLLLGILPSNCSQMLARATSFEGLNKSKGSTFEMPHTDGWQVGTTCWLGILVLLQLGPSLGLLPFPQGLAAGCPQYESPKRPVHFIACLQKSYIFTYAIFVDYTETEKTLIQYGICKGMNQWGPFQRLATRYRQEELIIFWALQLSEILGPMCL